MKSPFTLRRQGGREEIIPTSRAASGWGSMVRGTALTALLARALEREIEPDAGLIPARTTFELHSPVPLKPLTFETRTLRSGRRLRLLEADLLIGNSVYARARSLWLRPTEDTAHHDNPPWQPDRRMPPRPFTPAEVGSEGRFFWSEEVGWSTEVGAHKNSARKGTWQFNFPVVEGEEPSAFQLAGLVGDLTNLTASWGPKGVDFINADVTLSLSRLPVGNAAGVLATGRTEHLGIAIGTATLIDEAGEFGSTSISTLAQTASRVTSPGESD